MTDTLSPRERSERMRRIKGRSTKPETAVRRLLYRMGFRTRIHAKDLPGRPDIIFRSRKKVIFVHGCFWHRHPGCSLARMPKSRLDFWRPKLEGNRERDLRNQEALAQLGWSVLVVWECEIRDVDALKARLLAFLNENKGEERG